MVLSHKRVAVVALTLSFIPFYMTHANERFGYKQGEQFAVHAINAVVEKSKKHGKDGFVVALKELASLAPRFKFRSEQENFINGAVDGIKKMQIDVQDQTSKPDERASILMGYYLYNAFFPLVKIEPLKQTDKLSHTIMSLFSQAVMKAYKEAYGKDSGQYKELHKPMCPCCMGFPSVLTFEMVTAALSGRPYHDPFK